MRKRVTVICLNRMGVKLGSVTITTDSDQIEANELFKQNRVIIKGMYPTAVKLKIQKK